MNNTHKSITHNTSTQKEDDIMSTVEYVESLKKDLIYSWIGKSYHDPRRLRARNQTI